MDSRPFLLALLVAAAGLVGGCSDSNESALPGPPEPAAPVPASLRIVSGDQQRGIAGEVLPAPTVVQLLDSSEHPVPDHNVTFEVLSGGGSVSAGLTRSNSSGIVQVHWRLGPTPGEPQTLLVKLADNSSGGPLLYTTFTAVAEAAGTGQGFQVVQAGGLHSCGLTVEGQAYCWGENFWGALGNPETTERFPVPTAVSGGLAFVRIATGMTHTCALTSAGIAYCWGDNGQGQLGDGTRNSTSAPTAVSGGLVFQEIYAGYDHTCALTTGGTAYCWGGNKSGPDGGYLGDGTLTDRMVPTRVQGELTFQALALGMAFTCGLTTDGAAYCWGSGASGPLYTGIGGSILVPTAVRGRLVLTAISAGDGHVCGLVAGGQAYCWGTNYGGELGDGTLTSTTVPVAVSGSFRFAAIGAGGYHTCALTLSGALACWGWHDGFYPSGIFNGGTSIHTTTPVLLPGGLSFVGLSEGLLHGCGVTADHEAYCWFDNLEGELGNGTFTGSYQPVPVR